LEKGKSKSFSTVKVTSFAGRSHLVALATNVALS